VLVSADVTTFENGYRTGWTRGSKLFNEWKEQIGTIADFVLVRDLDPAAILQVGGLLDMGSHFVAVPFKTFVIGTRVEKLCCLVRRARRSRTFLNSNSTIEPQSISAARSLSALLSSLHFFQMSPEKDSEKIDMHQGHGGPLSIIRPVTRGDGFRVRSRRRIKDIFRSPND
jgi:hypothetical protein